MCSFKLLHMSDIISLMICWSNNLTLSSVVNKNETYNFTHFKQSYSYQSICLQLVSKWIIFVIAISIVICATMVKMICNHVFNYKMVLSCKWDYDLWLLLVWTKMKLKIVLWLVNVVHMWLNNMWCFVQLELWLYIIVANAHV
jgi:hypothetical protein